MALLSVDEAVERVLSGASPLGVEHVPLRAAIGRILAEDMRAKRTQPPFPASAMDGYAVRAEDLNLENPLTVIGETAAGHPFDGAVSKGQAVRIFTGAPVPDGADTILIQENALRTGDMITPTQIEPKGRYVRPAGLDFMEGDDVLPRGHFMDAAAISLAASTNNATLPVYRKPVVGVIATGDELVEVGNQTGPGQIIASNSFGIMAIVEFCGGTAVDLGIARDTKADLERAIEAAETQRCDVIVTIGGASVGDHDLVQSVMTARGMTLDFWKIAMRPGKPLISGHIGNSHFLGLPGNPVSSLVCGYVFLAPLVSKLAGKKFRQMREKAVLAAELPANENRRHFMRATATMTDKGIDVTPLPDQDSSILSGLARAHVLIDVPPNQEKKPAGSTVDIVVLRPF